MRGCGEQAEKNGELSYQRVYDLFKKEEKVTSESVYVCVNQVTLLFLYFISVITVVVVLVICSSLNCISHVLPSPLRVNYAVGRKIEEIRFQ